MSVAIGITTVNSFSLANTTACEICLQPLSGRHSPKSRSCHVAIAMLAAAHLQSAFPYAVPPRAICRSCISLLVSVPVLSEKTYDTCQQSTSLCTCSV